MTNTVTIERRYLASPQKVWAAWSDTELLTKWWGCAVDMLWNVHEWDFQVGGNIRVSMDFDGEPYVVEGRFVEIEEPNRLRYEWENGQIITVAIEPDQTGSRMVIEHDGLPEEMHEIVNGGWSASVEQILSVLA